MRVCPSCFGLYGPDQSQCPKDGYPTEDPTQVLIGKPLGPYMVRSMIGEGGMGVVYAGDHLKIGRRVALKVLRPELSLRDDIVERFVQEARAVNTIGHANIVNIYDFGRTPFGSFYIVMEYLDGKTVRAFIDEEGPQPLERVLTVTAGVGQALMAAHSKGFIHRDVKPENIIIIDRKGAVSIKLVDFGIVKLLTHEGPATHTGTAMGTPQYMCPEQLEDAAFDHRVDVYSLGAVAYEMITGRVPYPGRSHAEVRQLQLTQSPPAPSVVRPEAQISRKLDAAVLWALSPDPNTRCPRVEDFLAAFQAGYEDVATPSPPPPVTRKRPSMLVVGLVALVAMAAGGGIVYLAVPTGDGSRRGGTVDGARPDAATEKQLTEEEAATLAREQVLAAFKSPKQRVLLTELVARMRRPVTTLQPALRQALGDPHPTVKRNAAISLARMKDREAIPQLKRLLQDRTISGQTAWSYAESLAMLGEESGRERLRRDLKAQRSAAAQYQRTSILRALGRLKDRSVERQIAQLAGNPMMAADLRFELWGYLAAMGDKQALKELRAAGATSDWPTRIKAAEALAATDRDLAGQTLRQALEHTSGGDRLAAARELAHFGDATSAKFLVEFAKSTSPVERRDSILALGHLSGGTSRRAVVDALRDPDPEVALAAALALVP